MSTYTIGQVADRTGFTTSALRYYEDIGLVAPSARADNGYRVYDDQAVARLTFIDRAKQLGCSLDEITALVAVWEADQCDPVQQRIHHLVTSKIAETERQIGDLTALRDQLRTAAEHLTGPAIDGPCSDRCACLTEPSPSHAGSGVAVAMGFRSTAPIACTLDAGATGDRVHAWEGILDTATTRTTRPDGTLRIEFSSDVRLGELVELVAAEQRCCAFYSFAVTVDDRGVGLEITAPAGAEEMVAALFGGES